MKYFKENLVSGQLANPRVNYDIGMKAHGPQEDKAYQFNPWIQKNVRRGNTMVETNEDGRLIMVRKGLFKFYDVKIDFIHDKSYNNKMAGQITEADKNMRDYTLGPLNQFMAGLGSLFPAC
jgi:hypothetical protein